MGLISNYTKKFGETSIFANYTLQLPTSGLCFLLGNSGVGKTTLLRSIASLDNDYQGEITGFGAVSMMFQEYRLFPWLSALDNACASLGTGSDSARFEEAKNLLLELGFSEKDLTLKPSMLSGGMKQRVSFVRAFISGADTVLLDEPFKELDPALVKVMYDLITRESEKRLFIIVTHDEIPEEALLKSNVVRLGINQ